MLHKNQKKLQRKLNKIVRDANNRIKEDELWLGRFYVHQKAAKYIQFEPNYGELYVSLEFVDKKTGTTKTKYIEYTNGLYDPFVLSDIMFGFNDFIIEDCKVWEKEHPYEEKMNYA